MASREPKLIINVTRGSVVCERGVIADGPLARMRGLLGRQRLPTGEGLLLRPAPSIHTAFMRFPIDAGFLDSSLRIIKLVERIPAWRTAAARRAQRPPVGIVVIGDENVQGLRALPVLPKWGSFGRLFEAIEQARPEQRRRRSA